MSRLVLGCGGVIYDGASLTISYQPVMRSSDQDISSELSRIAAELGEIDGKKMSNTSEVRRIEERVRSLGSEVIQKVRGVGCDKCGVINERWKAWEALCRKSEEGCASNSIGMVLWVGGTHS